MTLGEYNLKEKESPVAKVETISKITMHPEFKCRFYINDVALVETTNSISWSESVQPACLPHETGKSGFDAFNGEEAVTAGWGWLGEDKSKGIKFKQNLCNFQFYTHIFFFNNKYLL